MSKQKKLNEIQKQELVDALNLLYPTPLGEKLVDRLDENYIKASEFIDKNYSKLDESLRAYFPSFIFKMKGDIEFACSNFADLDVICKTGDESILSFSATGKLEKVTSLKDFQKTQEFM